MKKLRWILPFLFLPLFVNAGQVSGYISLKWMGGYTYRITVTDYTNGDLHNSNYCDTIDVDTLRVYFGDNTSALLTRANGSGDSVCACRKENIYVTTHTFPNDGVYRIWANPAPRVADINNLVNSNVQSMELYNTLLIQYITQDSNVFPVIRNSPVCSYACTTQCYQFNLGAYSPGGDSLAYSLGSCLPGAGYYNPGATINDSGTFKWCPTAGDTGLWNFSIQVLTYKNIIEMGNPAYIFLDTEEVELQVNVESHCTLGITNIKDESGNVTAYPNPGNGLFTLVFASEAKQSQSTLEVYDILGKQVHSQVIVPVFSPNGSSWQTTFTVDLSNQPNGIYFYRMLHEDGSLVGDGKLMVEH